MKKLLVLSLVVFTLVGCNPNQGELVGVRKKTKQFYHPDPYGMAFVPMGSFTMGVGGQDITSGQTTQPKTISVSSFFMDETEITNNEYREFVYWVRDSIARDMLAENSIEGFRITENPKTGEVYEGDGVLNWETPIEWNSADENVRQALEGIFFSEDERIYGKKEIDPRKLNYQYYWIDLHAASKKEFNEGETYDYKNASFANRKKDRTAFVKNETINVYPDTLAWIHDYSYSFNDPLTEKYFWHVAYDNYPVVGVNWHQAKAFCVWRTEKLNRYLQSQKGETILSEFRLPTEAEWEWAARGGNSLNPYPWGGPYTRSAQGCFLANFKPLRGNYIADGGLRTLVVGHYPPNDWGLYDMSGNVAEWTNSAYDPISYNYAWDMNPNYTYNASEDDPAIMKRKVIRGGSWKDIAYYLEVSTRAYEYQDTAKCYIGFRCIQPYLGINKGDNNASHVY
ncbi:MAG: SUMF1/EgtB/PvdO family nonheme iron enzyme [Bacteroidales bacterium]|nr:SUMF1/EgtB/PvdO family nonheme iron enzyme [Bacteroidales bacterium]